MANQREIKKASRKRVRASTKKAFNWAFVLTEDQFRRIVELVRDSVDSGPGEREKPTTSFRATLTDESQITTDDIEVILAEENTGDSKINAIEVKSDKGSVYGGAGCSIAIIWDSGPSITVRYSVEGTQRDWVQLTASKIEERLLKQKQRHGFLSRTPFAWVLPMAGYLLLAFYSWSLPEQEKDPQGTPMGTLLLGLGFFAGATVVLVLIGGLIEKFVRYVFPIAIFAIGEEEKRYEKIAELRRNLFWRVIVPVIISLFVGLLFYVLRTTGA